MVISWYWYLYISHRIHLTYGLFTYIYHKNQPNVGKNIILGSYGYGSKVVPFILADTLDKGIWRTIKYESIKSSRVLIRHLGQMLHYFSSFIMDVIFLWSIFSLRPGHCKRDWNTQKSAPVTDFNISFQSRSAVGKIQECQPFRVPAVCFYRRSILNVVIQTIPRKMERYPWTVVSQKIRS